MDNLHFTDSHNKSNCEMKKNMNIFPVSCSFILLCIYFNAHMIERFQHNLGCHLRFLSSSTDYLKTVLIS